MATSTDGAPARSTLALAGALTAAGLGRVWRPPPPPDPDLVPIERILWIRLDHIGDLVMSLPALRAVQLYYPQAAIDLLVRPACRSLAQLIPGVRRVWTYNSPRMPERGHGAGLTRSIALARRLRRGGYQLTVETRGDDIARLLAYATGAGLRLGPDRIFYEAPGVTNFSFLLTHAYPLPETPQHAVLKNLQVPQPLGITGEPPPVQFRREAASEAAVAQLLARRGVADGFMVLHAASREIRRNWQPAGFAAVASELAGQGHSVVLIGARGDYATNERVRALLPRPQQEQVFNCAGYFSLEQLPALLARARFMVTVDSGPMHLAALAGVPMVALFLPELAPMHYPWGQPEAVVLPPLGQGVGSIAIAAVLHKMQERLAAPGLAPPGPGPDKMPD